MKKLLIILLIVAGLMGCKSAIVISEQDDDFDTVTIIFAAENPKGTAPITASSGALLGSFKRVVVNKYEEMYTEDRAMEVYDTSHKAKYFISGELVQGHSGFVIKDVQNKVSGYLLFKFDKKEPYFEVKLFDDTAVYVFGIDKNGTKYLMAGDELVYVKWEKNQNKDSTRLEYNQRSAFKKSYYEQHPEDALIFAAVFYLLADITYNKTFIYSM